MHMCIRIQLIMTSYCIVYIISLRHNCNRDFFIEKWLSHMCVRGLLWIICMATCRPGCNINCRLQFSFLHDRLLSQQRPTAINMFMSDYVVTFCMCSEMEESSTARLFFSRMCNAGWLFRVWNLHSWLPSSQHWVLEEFFAKLITSLSYDGDVSLTPTFNPRDRGVF